MLVYGLILLGGTRESPCPCDQLQKAQACIACDSLQHDKTIIVDGDAIATGSFNFAVSAETVNSENLIVVRGMPEVSRRYLAHWQSRWDLGTPYAARQE